MAATSPRKILTIDDEASIVNLIGGILESHQYEVMRATRWTDALDILNHDKPDLVLLDLKMPTIDGTHILKFIRDEGFQIPVIVVSGFITDEIGQSLSEYGVSGLISKPFEMQQLLDEIDRVLAQVPAPSTQSVSDGHPLEHASEPAGADPSVPAFRPPLLDTSTQKSTGPPPKEPPGQVLPPAVKHKRSTVPDLPPPMPRRIGRRQWKRLALLTLICVIVSGILSAVHWFAVETDFSQMKSNAEKAITDQAAQEYLKRIRK